MMIFYPAKCQNRLNGLPFAPDAVTGRAMVNPHYGSVWLEPGTRAICNSTAFQTMLRRKTPQQALDDQLRLETQLSWRMLDLRWRFEAVVHYDQMLGVDEAFVDGVKVKQRGTIETARPAIAATLASAAYYATQRHRIAGAIAFAAQGINPDQYVDECVVPMLDLMQTGDWLALGGFCIIGRVPSLKPLFAETLRRCLPLARRAGLARVHLLGVAVGDMVRLAAEEGRKAGVAVSTDTSSIEMNSVNGKVWDGGRWEHRWGKESKKQPGGYHPCDLALANIASYDRWSAGL